MRSSTPYRISERDALGAAWREEAAVLRELAARVAAARAGRVAAAKAAMVAGLALAAAIALDVPLVVAAPVPLAAAGLAWRVGHARGRAAFESALDRAGAPTVDADADIDRWRAESPADVVDRLLAAGAGASLACPLVAAAVLAPLAGVRDLLAPTPFALVLVSVVVVPLWIVFVADAVLSAHRFTTHGAPARAGLLWPFVPSTLAGLGVAWVTRDLMPSAALTALILFLAAASLIIWCHRRERRA